MEQWLLLGVAMLATGTVAGVLAGLFGIGGGIIAVPLMLIFLRLPIHLAVGNSSALIVVSSFAAVSCYIWYGLDLPNLAPFSFGYVNLLVAAIIAPLTIIFARVGIKWASRTSQPKLIKIFAILLFLVSLKILINF